MQLAFYKITTPDEKKGLQLIALLSKEDLSSKDHEEIQELLSLRHGSGINLNMRNRNRDNRPHQTALHMAVMNNHSQYVKALIEKGANVNVQDVYGKTPLHFALMYFYEDSIKALLNAGADPMIKDIHGYSPYDLAKIFAVSDDKMISSQTDEPKEDKITFEDEITPNIEEEALSTPSQKNLGESTFLSIKEEIQLVPQKGQKAALKEVHNLSQMLYHETISTAMRHLGHMAKELASLAHSTQVYNPNDVKKNLIQQSKNIQKAVARLKRDFINQRNA
ncbi:MAG: ankyrin repeat domain-containing protein [Alphaproteobacteria bacterium]|nr:ankyrin repeat domain-containing protein [Alphaproteobacteria bacterium]